MRQAIGTPGQTSGTTRLGQWYVLQTTKLSFGQGNSAIFPLNSYLIVFHLFAVAIAYEPVWAIGTGLTATPEMAQETHAAIRKWIQDNVSEEVAASIRIQYGGSMKGSNAEELLKQPDIDGGLIGGASLQADFFNVINGVPK